MCWGIIPAFARTSLGSTAITVDSSGAADSGAKASELRYKPYGKTRHIGLPNWLTHWYSETWGWINVVVAETGEVISAFPD